MAKKKCHLQKYVRRQVDKTRRHSTQAPNSLPITKTVKRPLERTPKTVRSFKSPFRPVLFHPMPKSPSVKKFKSSRTLFSPRKTPTSKIKCNARDKVRNTLSSNRSTGVHLVSECEYESDLELKLLSDEDSSVVYSKCKQTKALNINSESQTEENQQAIRLIPKVIDELSKVDGLDTTFVSFFEMVVGNRFPLDNMAFLLWIDVVKWFSCSSTASMRYNGKTKLFWKLGWRIFGKRFVNFMGGFKNHGENVLKIASTGKFSPESSEINFAVPDINVLRDFDPYLSGTERRPGIFIDTISDMSKFLSNKSACITFDGKKLKQGLIDDTGDVDLLGFERGSTLQEQKDALKKQLTNVQQSIQKVNDRLVECHELIDENTESALDITTLDEMKESLLTHLAEISESVGEIERVKSKKEYTKKKLTDISGPDWRKGKYIYAISGITAYIHELDSYINKAMEVSNQICRLIAAISNERFIVGRYVNLEMEERYIGIEKYKTTFSGETSTRLMVQRSQKWHELRNQAMVTGSTLYRAIGCDGLAKQKDHFEKVICGVPEKEHSAEAKAAMEWGTINEINAVATVVGKIIPVLEPRLKFYEEGCLTINRENGQTFMVVSPDGSLRAEKALNTTEVAIEIKCPTRSVHTEFPERYYLQCQAEMRTLNVDRMLYVSWTEEDTTVFRLTRDDELFDLAIKLAFDIYGNSQLKKPTKLSDDIKSLKTVLKKRSKDVKLVGRFWSCRQSECAHNVYDTTSLKLQSFQPLFEDIGQCYKERYELLREKATEAVVFLLADLDRSWQRKSIRCSPIAWFPKGYSLDSETMRLIAEEIHTRCCKSGVHVPCQSFDGQWHTLVVRSLTGEPLTVFQLQKDVWRSVEKMAKSSILAELKSLNQKVVVLHIVEKEPKQMCYVATNGGIHLPIYRKVNRMPTDNSKESVTSHNKATTCQEIDRMVSDVFASNVNEEFWHSELEEMQYQQDILEETEDEPEPIQDNASCHHVTTKENSLNILDMERLLSLLRTTKGSNKNCKWNDVSEEALLTYFSSFQNLKKLLDIELRVIVRYLHKSKGLKVTKESDNKDTKLRGIASFIGLSVDTPVKKDTVKKVKVLHLRELASKAVSKISKTELNIMMAEYIWPEAYMNWKRSIEQTTLNSKEIDWFYKPEYSAVRYQYEVKCIDSTHLLTRMRRKSCRGGLDMLTNESWMKVAMQKRTRLTPIMVEDVTDPMSAAMATTHFSEAVETEMKKNGDIEAAELCKDIRNWWDSEDKCGITASERIKLREPLRRRLMSRVEFSRFPPATQYVAGWPQQLWEATLANIDAKAYLYGLVHSGTYNVRAFSSLIGETFFSELTLNDKRGHGTVTAKEFGEFISRSTEQLQIRLDRERTFCYCTSKRKVYETVDEACDETALQDDRTVGCLNQQDGIKSHIQTRDHAFDTPLRRRLTGRKRVDHVSMDRNAVLKGSLGVRWEKARTNYSKMLPTKRMGLE